MHGRAAPGRMAGRALRAPWRAGASIAFDRAAPWRAESPARTTPSTSRPTTISACRRTNASWAQLVRPSSATARRRRQAVSSPAPLPVHRDLEAALCRLTGQPSALAFSTGYAANLGVLTALSGRGAEILLDAHAHVPARRSTHVARALRDVRAQRPAALDRELTRRAGSRVVVAVESIYSVLGDAAPLRALVEVCHRHDALLAARRGARCRRGRDGPRPGSEWACRRLRRRRHPDPDQPWTKGGAVLGPTAERNHLVNTARASSSTRRSRRPRPAPPVPRRASSPTTRRSPRPSAPTPAPSRRPAASTRPPGPCSRCRCPHPRPPWPRASTCASRASSSAASARRACPTASHVCGSRPVPTSRGTSSAGRPARGTCSDGAR